ncbi:hypothetical protein yrohd0001_37200 [Yersinia rohdei ATCC 43380]|nr:hypothetical protein yrohd0001_37200 [Yersinia rohdei ATCC 43380]
MSAHRDLFVCRLPVTPIILGNTCILEVTAALATLAHPNHYFG